MALPLSSSCYQTGRVRSQIILDSNHCQVSVPQRRPACQACPDITSPEDDWEENRSDFMGQVQNMWLGFLNVHFHAAQIPGSFTKHTFHFLPPNAGLSSFAFWALVFSVFNHRHLIMAPPLHKHLMN